MRLRPKALILTMASLALGSGLVIVLIKRASALPAPPFISIGGERFLECHLIGAEGFSVLPTALICLDIVQDLCKSRSRISKAMEGFVQVKL